MSLTRDFFIALSKNRLLNKGAKRWGLRLGASKVVAGIDTESAIQTIQRLNGVGISCTLDNLGEFVFKKEEALAAKQNIIKTLHAISKNTVDSHVSIKLTQIGLDIDQDFCLENMVEIMTVAKQNDIFINIDMEDYAHHEQTMDILKRLLTDFDNVGTVIQSYLHQSEEDVNDLKGVRLRIVKGAYKENVDVALQSKDDIDKNFIKLIKMHLLNNSFTSIATHDHHVINEIKTFVEANNISKDLFEFQMLYGFRSELQVQLVEEGYAFCTYVPFGEDWYGYFMRRLAERPQNLNLVFKGIFTKAHSL